MELGHDMDFFDGCTGREKSFISILSSLYSIHGFIIDAPIVAKISDEIQIPEARCYFGFMTMQRNIHDELFTVLLDLFTSDYSDKNAIIESCSKSNFTHICIKYSAIPI